MNHRAILHVIGQLGGVQLRLARLLREEQAAHEETQRERDAYKAENERLRAELAKKGRHR